MPSREWKRKVQKAGWYSGDTVNVGIGQGYVLSTPIQLASIATTLANRGVKKTPKLVIDPEGFLDDVGSGQDVASDNSAAEYELIVQAIRSVIHGEKGTARGIRYGLKYDIAGKTGTAQVVGIPQGAKYDAEKLLKS